MRPRIEYGIQSLLIVYDDLTLHRVPGPRSAAYFVPIFLTFACLLVPPSKLSLSILRYAALPVILMIQCLIWQRDHSFDVISVQTCLTSFAVLGWYDVRKNFKHIRRVKTGQEEEAYPSSLSKRLKWVATLILSIRFSDYLIQDPVHDNKQSRRRVTTTFKEYFQLTLLRASFSFALLDITSYIIQDTNHFPCLTVKGYTCPNTLYSLSTNGSILFTHVYAAASCLLAYLPALVLMVAIAPFPSLRYHPTLSPVVIDDIFGPISSIWQVNVRGWGLRAFWGTFWHQNLRYVTVTPGLALVALLKLSRRSLGRYIVVTTQAFFWSGCIHAGMVPPFPLGTEWSSTSLRRTVAAFFWLQPVGLTIEILVDAVRRSPPIIPAGSRQITGTKSVMNTLYQILALGWTASFLLVTLWATVLPVGRELGWWRLHPIPFSLSRVLVDLYFQSPRQG